MRLTADWVASFAGSSLRSTATELSATVARQGHLPALGAVTRVTLTVVSTKLAQPWPALVDLVLLARAGLALPDLLALAPVAWAVDPFLVLWLPGCLPL